MDHLPVELYQEIFREVTAPEWPWRQDPLGQADQGASAAPFALACVSHRWRDICLETSNIWSLVVISGTLYQRRLERAKCTIERARYQPLQLIVDANAGRDRHQLNPLVEIAALLWQHAHRWKRIHMVLLQVTGRHYLISLFDCRGMLPALEELVVVPPQGRSGQVTHLCGASERLPPLPALPMLRKFESHAINIEPDQPLLTLTQLQFSVRNVPETILWRMLEMTPALVELDIFFPAQTFNRQANPISPSHDITLPYLRRLGVFGFWGNPAWVRSMNVPQVDMLTVSIESCDCMQPLFLALGKQVRHVTLTSVDGSLFGILAEGDAAAMRDMECLETLELKGLPPRALQVANQSFFRFIQHGGSQEPEGAVNRPLWAGLRKIVLRNCEFYLAACQTMVEMVQARLAATATEGGAAFRVEMIDTTLVADSEQSDEVRVKHVLHSV